MAIPDYQSLMLPVLKLAALGETRVPIAANEIADELEAFWLHGLFLLGCLVGSVINGRVLFGDTVCILVYS